MVLHLLYNYNFLILKDMAGAGMIMEIIKMKERQGDKALDRLHDGIKTQMQTTASQGSWTGGAKPSQVVRDKTTVKEKPNEEEKGQQSKPEKSEKQKAESAPGSEAAPGSELKESDSAPESDLQEAGVKGASGGAPGASPIPMPMGMPGLEGGEGVGGGFANMGIIEMAQGASK